LDNTEQLQLIRDAQGDAALLALATVDLTFPDISGAERTALRSALEAAAVPHWCDASLLAKLMDSSALQNSGQWAQLMTVPVVEPFPARGGDAGNVHEASRLALRKRLAEKQPERFLELSTRLMRAFEADTRPIGRIEWVYHLLTADPERGAAELEELSRNWWATASHEDFAALSAALTELDNTQMLRGKAQVRARLMVADHRAEIGSAASLGGLPDQLLRAAQTFGDAGLIRDAYSLVMWRRLAVT
jgi:hypothetical protein